MHRGANVCHVTGTTQLGGTDKCSLEFRASQAYLQQCVDSMHWQAHDIVPLVRHAGCESFHCGCKFLGVLAALRIWFGAQPFLLSCEVPQATEMQRLQLFLARYAVCTNVAVMVKTVSSKVKGRDLWTEFRSGNACLPEIRRKFAV